MAQVDFDAGWRKSPKVLSKPACVACGDPVVYRDGLCRVCFQMTEHDS